MTRKMFIECKLVHADLSEYNILYHVEDTSSVSSIPSASETATDDANPVPLKEEAPAQTRGHLYIIDVSQSVEHDHPHAFDFLRADLRNIEDFFGKRGVRCLGLRRAFDFVTREVLPSVPENASNTTSSSSTQEIILHKWMEEPEQESEMGAGSVSADIRNDDESAGKTSAAHEDEVFMRSYIPRTLNEVYDPERDVGALSRGEGENLIYKHMIGVVGPKESRKSQSPVGEGRSAHTEEAKATVHFEDSDNAEGEDSESEEGEDGDGDSDSDDQKEGFEERRPRGHRHEDKEAKKERKKAVKEEARERRKHKIPKAEKKRKVKATARGG